MIGTEYVFIVILSLIYAVHGEYCTSFSEYSSRYCYYGCCGTWPNERCCGVYTWVIVVAVVGGIVGLIAVVVCIVCVVQKQHGRQGRIIDPVGPTVQVTTYQPAGLPSANYQPYYTQQQSYNPPQTNQQQYPQGSQSVFPPPPPPATYNQDPAFPPPKYQ